MQNLTSQGQNIVNDIAQRYKLSADAVMHMLIAVNNGGGGMAQFNCPELGGSGQWMSGGMTMVGDMFNNGLRNTVDNLCAELANALASYQLFPEAPKGTQASNQWWPQDLGKPFSSGGQNNSRYAIFPQRLVIDTNGIVRVYDTLDHQIGGVSQQQGGNDSLTFNSQYGSFSISSLPLVSGGAEAKEVTEPLQQNIENLKQPDTTAPSTQPPYSQDTQSANDILGLIEKLAQLRDAGILTEDEYNSKKSDLLSRL